MDKLELDDPLWSLGLMSGTSLDGVDAALLCTDGVELTAFGPGCEYPYGDGDVAFVREVMQRPLRFRPPDNDELAVELSQAEQNVDMAHASAAAQLLAHADQSPALIGYHGQTVAHAPEEGWTWQLGDGAALARALNRPVVWDFRSADVAIGGEGAPLAPFYHWALARHIGAKAPIAFLNVGGVANVTWVDPTAEAPEQPGALLAFDTGPGNALLNDWMQSRADEPLDRDGAAAAKGEIDWMTVHSGNSLNDYLARSAPKSLDRNTFSAIAKNVRDLSVEDGAATLTAVTVLSVVECRQHLPTAPSRWLICGGGRKNKTMMRMLTEQLDAPVAPVEAVGLDGDLLEAQAFAYLAVRSARGLPLSAPGTTGCDRPVTGGRLSRP